MSLEPQQQFHYGDIMTIKILDQQNLKYKSQVSSQHLQRWFCIYPVLLGGATATFLCIFQITFCILLICISTNADGIMNGDEAATEDIRIHAAEHLKHAPQRSGGGGHKAITQD
ncbi:hypothetical protein GOODEAATRI_030799 [Goodea atripinnis]|uniref:Uncharacterized protein n=1 Tax=Goodea atripinnis TaxID=208336 RepID=A0ABV0N5M2_9TELE